MENIIKSISRYNILNYLIPGTIFCVLLRLLTSLDLIQPEIYTGVFLYYFVGLIISRIGSLIVEPIFKKLGIISYAPYAEYIRALKNDPQISDLSEANNAYRTFAAMCIMLLVSIIVCWGIERFQVDAGESSILLVLALIVLFIFSHRKQTSFIKMRVQISNDDLDNG